MPMKHPAGQALVLEVRGSLINGFESALPLMPVARIFQRLAQTGSQNYFLIFASTRMFCGRICMKEHLTLGLAIVGALGYPLLGQLTPLWSNMRPVYHGKSLQQHFRILY